MFDPGSIALPPRLPFVRARTQALGFAMACEDAVGALLRTLATSKRNGRLLEIGTGTGVGTAWLLDGMDASSNLITVDINAEHQQVAREAFAGDPRLEIVTRDAAEYFRQQTAESFDLIFADAMPGKFDHLDEALLLVKRGGFYLVDDLLPQKNWPEDHAPKVETLVAKLTSLSEFRSISLACSSGIIILVRT